MAEELGLIPINKQNTAIRKYDFTENPDFQLYTPNHKSSAKIRIRELYLPDLIEPTNII